ncbi:Caspase domain-containing protein [Crocosphaera sp. UHCC 0190]|uniref:Caspase domain-containing protein n=1 Tax=Crocosphaera sp. UHCC 0190 TaxID=3110246 RepID=UPI002B20775D|nr:Caspase domain-containing protein [Crocosphaera sp. UHCC 0190]MEA5509275.1 Caspase domain-containing protein [Crocosphaera sp. UHCC 0190]
MSQPYQNIIICLLSLSLVGLLDKSSSGEYTFRQSFQGWFLQLLQGEKKDFQKPLITTAFISDLFQESWQKSPEPCEPKSTEPNFLVIGGGGSPESNEIALEKNLLYFQRTLKNMGFNTPSTSIFFANGNEEKPSIRYINSQGQEQFKIPNIPNLNGSATVDNFKNWIEQNKSNQSANKPLFFYFTGHGILNHENANNNAFMLWNNTPVTVRNFSNTLDKLPQDTHIVTMMAQCFSGSFANFIYQNGDPNKPLAKQTRCGFFATIKTLPSVGCTPEVNEADYEDYSSSFFAGLSGVNRIGQKVTSADYNKDGRVSYSEAHAFAKVDEETSDLPVSTSETWLQEKASKKDIDELVNIPILELAKNARPEQKYVISSLVKLLQFNPQKSSLENLESLTPDQVVTQEQKAYKIRLLMELLNVKMEAKVRQNNNQQDINILDGLIKCESSSWK